MDPYVHEIMNRNAQAMRDRAAAHTQLVHEVMTERAAVRRIRRLVSVDALLGRLRGHASHGPVPAPAGGPH